MTPEQKHRQPGRVNRYFSNYYYVELLDGPQAGQEVQAMVRALLRKQQQTVLAGDRVWLEDAHQDTAWIVAVDGRRNELERPRIANVDQVLVVMPWQQPAFDGRQLNRTLTQVALQGLPTAIAVTKTDLAQATDAQSLAHVVNLYKSLGYPVFTLSTFEPERDWAALRQWLGNGITVLAGISGAGKSSLLNQLNPDLSLKTGEVSSRIERGQHTTRGVSLLEVLPGAWVADTPGFSLTKLTGATPTGVEATFSEFGAWRGACDYTDCLHLTETGCAAEQAVQQGKLDRQRLESYRELVAEAIQETRQRREQSQKEESATKSMDRKGQGQQAAITRLNARHRATSRRRQRQEALLPDEELADSVPTVDTTE